MNRAVYVIMIAMSAISSLHALQLMKNICTKKTASVFVSAARVSNLFENKLVAPVQKWPKATFVTLPSEPLLPNTQKELAHFEIPSMQEESFEKDPCKAKAVALHGAMLKAIGVMDEAALKKIVNDPWFMFQVKPGIKRANISSISPILPGAMNPLQYAIATYLHTADARCIPMIQMLLDANVNATLHMTDSRYTCQGDFVLHAILLMPYHPKDIMSLIEMFIKAGVPVDCRSVAEGREGQTPLMRAIQLKQKESVVDALLAAGADFSLRDDEGRGVADYYRLAEE